MGRRPFIPQGKLKATPLKSKTNGGEVAFLASAGECNETRQNASAAKAVFHSALFSARLKPCPDVGHKSAGKRAGKMPFVPQDEPAVRKAKGKFKRAGETPAVRKAKGLRSSRPKIGREGPELR